MLRLHAHISYFASSIGFSVNDVRTGGGAGVQDRQTKDASKAGCEKMRTKGKGENFADVMQGWSPIPDLLPPSTPPHAKSGFTAERGKYVLLRLRRCQKKVAVAAELREELKEVGRISTKFSRYHRQKTPE